MHTNAIPQRCSFCTPELVLIVFPSHRSSTVLPNHFISDRFLKLILFIYYGQFCALQVVAVQLHEPQASTTPSSAQGTPSFSTGPRIGRSFFGTGASRGLGFGGSGNLWGSSTNRTSTGQQQAVTTPQGGAGNAIPGDPSSIQPAGATPPDVPETTGASQGSGAVTAPSQQQPGGLVGTGGGGIGIGIGVGVAAAAAAAAATGGGGGGGVVAETGGSQISSPLPPSPALSVDGPGAYLLFNVGDSLLIADASSPEKVSRGAV